MGREWLGSRGPLLITNVTDADSDATVLGTSRGQGRSNSECSPRAGGRLRGDSWLGLMP